MRTRLLFFGLLIGLLWTSYGCGGSTPQAELAATEVQPTATAAQPTPTLAAPGRVSVPLQFLSEWTNTKRGEGNALGADPSVTFPQQYYARDPLLEMVIQGEFPKVRYFSFVAYDDDGLPIATLRDRDIVPDQGSVNPFQPGADWNTKDRRYTIVVRFAWPASTPASGGPSTNANMPSNIMSVAQKADGQTSLHGRLAYYRYLPSEDLDADGGVGQPVVYYRKVSDGSFAKPPQWKPTDDGESPSRRSTPVAGPSGYMLNGLQWRRPADAAASGGNSESTFMTASITPDPSVLLLIRWKAPTFPDTYHNKGIRGNEQVRFWDLSFVDSRQSTTVFSLADYQAFVGRDGYVNLVVGFGAPRPAKATAEFGYTWIDLKNRPVTTLVYRNMMPAKDFRYSIDAVPNGALATDQLGDYLPIGRFILPDQF